MAENPEQTAKPAVVDLFCGAGGMGLGFRNAGFRIAGAYDNWTPAVATCQRNMRHGRILDLSDPEAALSAIGGGGDAVIGGPPCQDFSTAGKRTEGERASLTESFAEIVSGLSPKCFVMENVPRARTSDAWGRARGILEGAGYEVAEHVLDASLCGVPQRRRRLFAFGSRMEGACGRFSESVESRLAESPLTVREALGDGIGVDHYYRHPRNYSRRAVFSVDEPSPTIRGVNRPVPPNYAGNHLDSADPATVRSLTIAERSLIQTFPPWWRWQSEARRSRSDIELQIGNAVPVNLAAFVARGVLDAMGWNPA